MASHSKLIDVSQVTSERVKKFRFYWPGKLTGRSLPPRDAIDPAEIPRLLPYLVIAEIERKPLRVRYRLVGTRVVEANGHDFTNRYLDECKFAVEPLLVECYRRLVATRGPVFAYYEWNKSEWHKPTGRVGGCETGFFPLSNDGITVDGAISMADSGVPPRQIA
ncbi:PAS domain-containing protein [Dongia deserti]|uniref:PAS domain-containing protein n=1 Tax=Dongia deserti TaxID=2268030 RepID=UPI000E65499E|nr:PAS domain-containing protein [Dongia deserti]